MSELVERSPKILSPMTWESEMLRRFLVELVESAGDDSQNWFPKVADNLGHATLGLCGEVGEFANKVKKIDRGSVTLPEIRETLLEELTDVFVYFLCCAHLIGLDLLEGYIGKREFNEERFGYSE